MIKSDCLAKYSLAVQRWRTLKKWIDLCQGELPI